jgi:hypothetical protein
MLAVLPSRVVKVTRSGLASTSRGSPYKVRRLGACDFWLNLSGHLGTSVHVGAGMEMIDFIEILGIASKVIP